MTQHGKEKLTPQQAKEERLAAKLRENLRRRKAQGRELSETDSEPLPKGEHGS
jgi:hypothetical protein